MYTRSTEFCAYLREEMLSEIALFTTENPEPRPIWRLYWGNYKHFFKHMCMSAKVPAVVNICHQASREDNCVVIGLQSTDEARTEEAVAKCGTELVDFISGPRELLLKFVEENYLLPEKPEFLLADSKPESAESDDEFQICQICNSETERKKLLQFSCYQQLLHPACLVPPVTEPVSADWSCLSCKEKTEEYLRRRRMYLAQRLERYDKATERKSQS